MTNCRWCQGGAKVEPKLREGSTERTWSRREQPRRLHEGFMKPLPSLHNHRCSAKASRTLHDAVAAHRHRGIFAEPSSSLPRALADLSPFNKPPGLWKYLHFLAQLHMVDDQYSKNNDRTHPPTNSIHSCARGRAWQHDNNLGHRTW